MKSIAFHWAILFIVYVATAKAKQNIFPAGQQYSYQLTNDVFIRDFNDGRPIAYRLIGTINVANILEASDSKLLKFSLNSPELHVRPHGSDSQTEFTYHKSPLDSYDNSDFYGIWKSGNITDIYYEAKENLDLVNIKKAVVALFQYQTTPGDYSETQAAGQCTVNYEQISQTGTFKRLIRNCVQSENVQTFIRPEIALQANIQSYRSTDYEFNSDSSVQEILSRDYFRITMQGNNDVGGAIDSMIKLGIEKKKEVGLSSEKTPKAHLSQLKNYKGEKLATDVQKVVDDSKNTNLKKLLAANVEELSFSSIGSASSAKAFLDILPLASTATKEELVAVLKAKKFADIKPAILDILGNVQTKTAHDAVTEVIDFADEANSDLAEGYLQALAVGSRSNAEIIADLLKVVKSKSIDSKLKTTFIHTLGALANRYSKSSQSLPAHDIVADVLNYFNESIAQCEEILCFVEYLNGFNNLQSPKAIDLLFSHINDSDRTVAVAAAKALRKYPSSLWNRQHIKQFEEIFYQKEKRFDSSVRTLALDIVLDTKLSDNQISKLVAYYKSTDRAYEVKKYLLEKIAMLSVENTQLAERVQKLIRNDKTLNNYDVLAPKGMTTALSRNYAQQSPFDGTLTSIQEIFGGILKRGAVDMTFDSPGHKYSYFTLGLYSGGLQSFVSSEAEQAEAADEPQDDVANAGMEITVQNSYLRPLEFFRGQGELMGHVWSGTASEPTPAYVANSLLHDHYEVRQLHNGASIFVDVKSALSIDLNGSIQMSLWNRNAQIQVNKNVGLVMRGKILLNAGFVSLDLNFNVEKEPKLNLNTDVDFAVENVLCMQLSQPDDVFKYELEKNQIIPVVRHHVKSTKTIKYQIAGFTHFLNKKNNEMCNKIFTN